MDESSKDVIRLDRSNIGYGNFGFAIYDVEKGEIIHAGDVVDNVEIGKGFE